MIDERAKKAIWGAVLESSKNRIVISLKDLAKDLFDAHEFIFSENTPESRQDTQRSTKPKDTSDTERHSPLPPVR